LSEPLPLGYIVAEQERRRDIHGGPRGGYQYVKHS
jgi:hypothetical protein